MRKIIQPILISCLLAASIASSSAQNTVIDLTQEVRFKLTGYYQMNETENANTLFRNAGKVSITNKDIINLIEREVNIIFKPDARLLLISRTPVDLTPKVVIRDSFEGESFDTDVTQYFSAEVLASIEDAKIKKNPYKAKGSSYDLIVFQMNVPQLEFRILGFGKTRVSTGKYEGQPTTIVHTGKVEVSGDGDYQVNPLTGVVPVALTGKVEISGSQVKASVE